MRVEVFKIKEDNWGVRLSKGFEIAGFESAPAAHLWILQWILQITSKALSDEAMKRTLKEGQDQLDRILREAAMEDEKKKKDEKE